SFVVHKLHKSSGLAWYVRSMTSCGVGELGEAWFITMIPCWKCGYGSASSRVRRQTGQAAPPTGCGTSPANVQALETGQVSASTAAAARRGAWRRSRHRTGFASAVRRPTAERQTV